MIYPNEKRFITKITQLGDNTALHDPTKTRNLQPRDSSVYEPLDLSVDFECEIYAEGIPMKIDVQHIPEIIETITLRG